MTNISKLAKTLAVATLCMALSPSWAQKAGDLILSVGAAYMKPNASIGPLTSSSSDPTTQSVFQGKVNGGTASIKGTSTETLGAFYMWTDQIASELTIGIPPKMTVDVGLPSSGAFPGAASANVIDPSLVAKYLFKNPGDSIRPYLGLGVTNASFTSVQAGSDPLVTALAGTSVSLSSSWAPVFNAGFLYNFDEKWSLNSSLSYVPLKTNVTFVGPGGAAPVNHSVTTTGVLTVNPWDLVIRIGYKF